MTRGQNDIKRYIDMQFIDFMQNRDYCLKPLRDRVSLEIQFTTGKIKLTTNVYGDIVDCRTGEVIAESNLPHDISKLYGFTRPVIWTTDLDKVAKFYWKVLI